MNAITSTNFRTEPITEDYEWMYYNDRLRIIHSINDDMFHMKSIVDALHPDIVAKEGYTLDQWPEGRLAQSYGGKAVILKRLEGYSTSNLVEKMKGTGDENLYRKSV